MIAAGHSVQSHTWQHPNTYDSSSPPKEPRDWNYPSATTAAYYLDDYEHSKNWIQSTLQTAYPDYQVLALAYGNGRGPEPVGRQFYIACRGVMSGASPINRAGKTNYFHVMSDSISGAATLTNMNNRLAAIVDPSRTNEYGGWYCVHGHQVQDGNGSRGVWESLFSATLVTAEAPTALREKLWIDTFVNVAKYGQERDSAALTITANTADFIKYTLTDLMNDTIFDYPLTVKIKLPALWNNVSAVQGGQELPCAVVQDGGSSYALIKTVPDRGEVTVEPGETDFTAEILESAFTQPDVHFNTTTNPGFSPQENLGSIALFYLSLTEYLQPGIQSAGGVFAKNRALAHIRSVISGGKEPHCSNGPFWAHAQISSALTMAKKTAAIWNALSPAEQAKADLLMKALAISVNWGYNDANDFPCGLNLSGNFRKSWNPNYRCSYIPGIINAVLYFGGADAVNAIFTGFDYDAFTAELAAAGFTNITTAWAAAGKTLMENGGAVTAATDGGTGSGTGVRAAFRYNNMALSNIYGIMQNLISYTYQSTVQSSYGSAYIIDSTQSPFNGQQGMLYEFASNDANGIRSDAEYCAASFTMLVPAVTLLKLFGGWDGSTPAQQSMDALMAVGNEDLIYKLEHGYHSWSKGEGKNHTEASMHHGYPFAKDIWRRALNHSEDNTTITGGA